MAIVRIKGITLEIGGDTQNLSKSLKNVNSDIRNTQSQLKDVQKLLKLDPTNTELLRQKQQLLKAAVSETKEKLEALKKAQETMDANGVDKNSEQYMALQREIISTQSELDKLEEAAARSNVALEKISATADKVAQGASKIADSTRALSAAAGAGLAAIGGAAYSAVTSADDLNTLAKQTGFTTAELQKMKYAADLVDVSMEDITASSVKLKKNMTSGADSVVSAFKTLGVSTRGVNGELRDSTTVYWEVINALSHVGNEEVLEADTPRIRLVLIGGGQGGQGGQRGENGKTGIVDSEKKLAQPGKPGNNGMAGRIRMIQIDSNIEAEYEYFCGNGGAGGGRGVSRDEEMKDGMPGGATIFGEYSSEFGAIPEVGFIDPLSGRVYGGPSPDYSNIVKSGRGGGYVEDDRDALGAVYVPPESGVAVVNEAIAEKFGYEPGQVVEVNGGKGGGYQFGNICTGFAGGGGGGPVLYLLDANDNRFRGGNWYENGKIIQEGYGGDGPDGIDGPDPFVFSKTAYGRGGIGGHGGAGGGSSGKITWCSSDYTVSSGRVGYGGCGGKGSDGAPGCILVYY